MSGQEESASPEHRWFPRLPRAIIVFLIIVAIGTIAAVATTAMPPSQSRPAAVTTTAP